MTEIIPTELLYQQDSFLAETTAKVLLQVSKDQIVLDRTIFHPQGGGQPSDTGRIVSEKGSFIINKVSINNGIVTHFESLVEGVIEIGDEIRLQIDQNRRIRNSILHTAGHLLFGVCKKLDLPLIERKGYHFEGIEVKA